MHSKKWSGSCKLFFLDFNFEFQSTFKNIFMNEIKAPQMSYIGKKLAYYSALFGTIILLAYLISHAEFLVVLGLFYLLSAFVINGIFLFAPIIEPMCNTAQCRAYIIAIICMLLNIPLVLLYIFILSYFNL